MFSRSAEIPRLGRIYDKLGRSLLVLNESLEVNYSSNTAKSLLENNELWPCDNRWKMSSERVSKGEVFFLRDSDMTEQEEIWVKLQLFEERS